MTTRALPASAERQADVIVVGAGPGGSTTADLPGPGRRRRPAAGEDRVPAREGLRRRSHARARSAAGRAWASTLDEPGWIRNQGLRIIGGGHRLELPWPDLADFPTYGLVRTRDGLRRDPGPARAEGRRAPARADRRHRADPRRAHRPDRRRHRQAGRRAWPQAGDELTFRAPLVVAADGNSTRLSLAMGLHKRDDRPMGVAVRTYYTSPRHDDDWLESWLELWDGKPGESNLLPGYGWIFGVGDGTVNVGLGILNTSSAFQNVDYKDLLKRWLDHTPEEWGFRDENMTGRSAARPCRWASTASRTTPTACCWSATPAAWSTRSTARASRTRWSPARWPPTSSPRPSSRTTAAGPRAGAPGLPERARPALRRLLHARPRVREG